MHQCSLLKPVQCCKSISKEKEDVDNYPYHNKELSIEELFLSYSPVSSYGNEDYLYK